jgi:hypothetical protein
VASARRRNVASSSPEKARVSRIAGSIMGMAFLL